MYKFKLSDEEVLKIPELLAQGLSQRQVAEKVGLAPTTLRRIINKKSYYHLQNAFQEKMVHTKKILKYKSKFRTCTKCCKTLLKTKEYFGILSNRKVGFEARCLKCKAKQNKVRLDNLRLEALQHYSASSAPFCQCCKETFIEFLTIDHVDGDGNTHRKKIKGKFSTIGQWLKRMNYPKGFRVLCGNCNISLGLRGYCPHNARTC